MRYIKKDVIVDAFKIVSVGPEKVAAIGQPALVQCELENGNTVSMHKGHTNWGTPVVGDYFLADGTYASKKAFEDTYAKEYYGGSDGQQQEINT
jgi:hypothetical protein